MDGRTALAHHETRRMKLAYRYRFYPTPEQAQVLARTFGCVRYVYNFGLELRSKAYRERGESPRYKDTSTALTLLKKQVSTRWLREVSCVPLQQTLRHLDKAFAGFFEKRRTIPASSVGTGSSRQSTPAAPSPMAPGKTASLSSNWRR